MQETLPLHNLGKTTRRTTPSFNRKTIRRFAGMFTLVSVLTLWQTVTMFGWVEPYLLPAPTDVFASFREMLANGRLWLHTRITLMEVLGGLVIGISIGTTLGYLIAKSRTLEDLLSPVIVTFQSTPIVAYAPLLVIWFGSGVEGKIVTSSLIVFFPMLMNTIVGIRNVSRDLYDLMRVSQATQWQIFTKLEIPAALPVLMTGLKTSATLAVIGAVVGEFVVANAGLGFMINIARSTYDTPMLFVAVIMLAVIAGGLYFLVSLLERRLLAWQRRQS